MATIPLEQDFSEDPYGSPDRIQTMDIGIDNGSTSNGIEPAPSDHGSDVDSSTKMDMSEDEDSDAELQVKPISQVHAGTPMEGIAPALENEASSGTIVQKPVTLPGRLEWRLPVVNREPANIQTIQDLDQLIDGLPIPIWQRIACNLDPVTLAKLSQVSRLFRTILSPKKSMDSDLRARLHQDLRYVNTEIIWQVSRTIFASDLPRPLKGRNEREMWRLLRGNKCQVCGQEKHLINTHDNPDPWHSGPGQDGTRVLYLCAIRICGDCLPQRCQQEVALQLSTTFPSFLIQALPGIYLSQYNDWISEKLVTSVPPPPHLTIRKLFYQPHIDAIWEQFKKVKDLGDAVVAEWIKGLEQQRLERFEDTLRWEQWEARGGLGHLNARRAPKAPVTLVGIPSTQLQQLSFQQPTFPGSPGVMAYPPGYPGHASPAYQMQGPSPIQPTAYAGHPYPSYGHYSVQQNPSGMQGPPNMTVPHYPGGRPRRSLQEVNEARAARRHEIERRCLALDPPITPRVLSHIPAFQAALQITFPFTDHDWEVLLPRVLAQREAAEAQEAVLSEQLRVIQTTAAQAPVEVLVKKESHELSENDWESVQIPVHKVLARLADEYIFEKWNGDTSITHDTAPQFAADVLLTVRSRYYHSLNQPESKAGKIPLSLESMRWLYDNKVRGHAEAYQKELFQCSGCDYNSRYYGFEGVIQHFAAKHTTSLSLGNVIVNWRTEWPEVSPFNPHPGTPMNGWQQSHGNRVEPTSNHIEHQTTHQSGHGAYQQQSQSTNFDVSSYQDPTGGLPVAFGKQGSATTKTNGSGAVQSANMPVPATDSDVQRQQLIEMAQYSRDLWHATNGVKEMPASVRTALLIQHMSKKFENKFEVVPEILMFLHGLNDNAQMRPIRSLNGLHCKLCNANLNGSARYADKKTFTLPAIVNHFKNAHLTPGQLATDIPGMDWRFDMVEMPEKSVIEALVDSNGMDERKFALLTAIFPDVFQLPLPSLSSLKKQRAEEAAAKQQAEATRSRLEKLKALEFAVPASSQAQQSAGLSNTSRTDLQRTSQERIGSRSPYNSENGATEPPGEYEYDPSKPSFYGSIVEHSGVPRSAGLQKPKYYELPPGIVSLGVVDDNGQPESPHTLGGFSDRLLRHHRGFIRRPESGNYRRDSYPTQESPVQPLPTAMLPTDSIAADKFLENLVKSIPQTGQQNRSAYASNAYSSSASSPVEHPPRHQYSIVQQPPRDPVMENAAIHYAYPPVEQRGYAVTEAVRYVDDQVQYRAAPPPEQRWDHRAAQPVYGAQQYVSRDRSRSPRRSVPREYGYDGNSVQPTYEERPDFRWRGESPQRATYYRGAPEPTYGRPGDSFVGRDAQGRNVRYVAVPVDEYERGYAPARAAALEPPAYMPRPGEMVETGPDGRHYMVDQTVRYAGDGNIDGRYRQ